MRGLTMLAGLWGSALVVIGSNNVCGQDEALRDRLLAEAPTRWAEYREVGRRFQSSHTTTDYDLVEGDRKVRVKQHYEYKQNARCAMELFQPLPPLPGKAKPTGKLNVINAKYRFQLQRPDAESGWVLVDIDTDPANTVEPRLSPDMTVQAALVDKSLMFSSIHERLPELIRDPDFKILAVEQSDTGERQGVRVKFSSRAKKTEQHVVGRSTIRGAWVPLTGGWFDLDPERYWTLQRYEVQTTWQDGSTGEMKSTFEYKEGTPPLLKRVATTYNQLTGQEPLMKTETVQEYEVTQGDPPDLEFTLSAFGLPEPVGVTWEKPTPVYVWLLAAAGVFGVLALAFRWMVRRRPAAPVTM